jgi:putative ABC transport system permease protein
MPIVSDLRYAFRLLVRQRSTALLVILTLALGIGATSAMFSVIHGVLLRPLPFNAPDQIVQISPFNWKRTESASASHAPADYLDLTRDARSYSSIAGYVDQVVDLNDGVGEPERLEGTQVTDQYFTVFGVAPALGRTFDAAHAREDRGGTIVLGHDLWQKRFGGSASVLGRAVRSSV